jgi:hypothetical protein
MEFRGKIETVLAPLVAELQEKLALLPTLAVFNHYQLRIDAVQTDKSGVPDGFIIKWRYLWALLLSNPFLETNDHLDPRLGSLDELIEKIFETYAFGAIEEPGRVRGSEKEFLTRLGLGLRVREPDVIAFPEQIQKWASARLQPFDDSYFLPTFGLRFEEILAWIGSLIGKTESRLNACVQDLASIYEDVKPIHAAFVGGDLTIGDALDRMLELKIGERLDRNARTGEAVHIFSIEDLECGIPKSALQALLKQFGIRPGEIGSGYAFPHDENPLEYKTFVVLPYGNFYFVDPANAYRIATKTFEKEILADSRLRDRYLRKRDRSTERWVTEGVKKLFSGAEVFPNYYLERGEYEKDLFVRDGDAVILIECKNSRVRPFRGSGDDLLKFQEDFRNSVQFGYGQALEVKRRILGSEETTFFDEKGKPYFSVRRNDVSAFYIVCVTITPRGPFGTDLSYELKKPEGEPFPLAVNLFDLDTICKHLSRPEQFVAYLRARENLHGRVCTGDELNFAGYFLKYGNLDFEDHTQLADDFSGIFDRRWYKEKGIEVEEPNNPPVRTSMTRKGNRVLFEHSTGRKEVIRVPPHLVERASGKPVIRMKGSNRNRPCPCGSGRKLKHCHGIS